MCETLYSQGAGAVTAPYLAYAHSASVVSGELSTGSSSISGFSFYTTGSYPAGYVGALLRRLLAKLHLGCVPGTGRPARYVHANDLRCGCRSPG